MWTEDIIITKEMIVAHLEKDAEHLDDMGVQRLIKSCITKIHAHGDSVNTTVGVSIISCGGRGRIISQLLPVVENMINGAIS